MAEGKTKAISHASNVQACRQCLRMICQDAMDGKARLCMQEDAHKAYDLVCVCVCEIKRWNNFHGTACMSFNLNVIH